MERRRDWQSAADFDAISVRDTNSGNIVETLTGRTPAYHLDPVLMYDYIHCCDKIPELQVSEKYLILYAYSGRISDQEADWIAAYAKKKKLKSTRSAEYRNVRISYRLFSVEVLAYLKMRKKLLQIHSMAAYFSHTHRRLRLS